MSRVCCAHQSRHHGDLCQRVDGAGKVADGGLLTERTQ